MLKYIDKIYDDIHGFIEITKLEKEIINSPYFQRLKEIKQLGLTYFIFPGATHTRFAHSIGVMKIADQMIRNIILNTDFLRNKYESYNSKDREEVENEVKKIRVAALLHDIGHYPLSHLTESVYREYMEEQRVLNLDAFLNNETNGSYISEEQNNFEDHEEIGSLIIRNTSYQGGITNILQKEFSQDDIDDIANIIRNKSATIWYNNIINSELDADRLDYLLRDSCETGVTYGNIDHDYLLKHVKLHKKDGQYIVVMEESAVFPLDHFLLSRYFWYAQIIYERTTIIFNKMASIIYKFFIQEKQVYSVNELKEIIMDKNKYQRYLQFNDHYFWKIIYDFLNKTPSGEKEKYFYKMCDLLNRRIPLRECNFNRLNMIIKEKHNNQEIKNNLQEIEKMVVEHKNSLKRLISDKEKEKWIIESLKSNVLTNWNDSYSKIVDEEEIDPIYILSKSGELKNLFLIQHSLANKLSQIQLLIPRIYLKEDIYKKNEEAINNI